MRRSEALHILGLDDDDAARSWYGEEDGVEVEYLTVAEVKARLSGIAAARVALVSQRDGFLDERRNGLIMAAAGAAAALLTLRRPYGIFGVVAAIAVPLALWGIVSAVGAQRNVSALDKHLQRLAAERKEYEALLEA